jgi:hypothetical protein
MSYWLEEGYEKDFINHFGNKINLDLYLRAYNLYMNDFRDDQVILNFKGFLQNNINEKYLKHANISYRKEKIESIFKDDETEW